MYKPYPNHCDYPALLNTTQSAFSTKKYNDSITYDLKTFFFKL